MTSPLPPPAPHSLVLAAASPTGQPSTSRPPRAVVVLFTLFGIAAVIAVVRFAPAPAWKIGLGAAVALTSTLGLTLLAKQWYREDGRLEIAIAAIGGRVQPVIATRSL